MLTIKQIEQQYPESLRSFKRALLREYFQYKILEIIFVSEYAEKISFLGGTALRIMYENKRFSEDLDFDNFGLNDDEFEKLAQKVRTDLEAQGLDVEINTAGKDAYRCRIKLPRILFDSGLSQHQEEKILIQVDSLAHEFKYKPEKKILNKFDVFLEVFVTPADILLSQKIYAAVNRKRAKGRDFYDIVFLLSFSKPNYEYLKDKLGIDNAEELKKKLLESVSDFDFKRLSRDVQPFLFNAEDAKKVELFKEFIKQASL